MDLDQDLEQLNEYLDVYMYSNGLTEITADEYMRVAFEYFEENPLPDLTFRSQTEAMTYNRITGEFDHWYRVPFMQVYWRKGFFFNDVAQCLICNRPGLGRFAYLNPRRWLEYFGVVDPKPADDYYMYGR